MLAQDEILYVQWGLWVLSLAMGPCCQFLESNLFYPQPELFGDFHVTPWPTTQLFAT